MLDFLFTTKGLKKIQRPLVILPTFNEVENIIQILEAIEEEGAEEVVKGTKKSKIPKKPKIKKKKSKIPKFKKKSD